MIKDPRMCSVQSSVVARLQNGQNVRRCRKNTGMVIKLRMWMDVFPSSACELKQYSVAMPLESDTLKYLFRRISESLPQNVELDTERRQLHRQHKLTPYVYNSQNSKQYWYLVRLTHVSSNRP